MPVSDTRTVYSKSSWANLADFTVVGASPTIVSNAIRMASGAPDFDAQRIEILAAHTGSDAIDFSVTFTIVSLTGTPYGMFIGRRSVNTWYDASLSAQLSFNDNPDVVNFWPQASSTPGTLISQATLAGNGQVGDSVKVTYQQRGPVITIIVNNITQSTVQTNSITCNLASTKNFKIPNTSRMVLGALGGSYDITAIEWMDRQPQLPSIAFVGDSKTAGYCALTYAASWPQLSCTASGLRCAVFAGDGDRTTELALRRAEILATLPGAVVLCIGRNDPASGTPTATWQASYSAEVAAYKAAGIRVVHVLGPPETVSDQTAIWAWINSTFAGDTRIDTGVGWVNGTHLSSDSIHPNVAGHLLISGLFLSGFGSRRAMESMPFMGLSLHA